MAIEPKPPIQYRQPSEFGLTPETQGMDLNAAFDNLVQKASGVTEEMLAGELPEDVRAVIEQASAEQAIQAGLGQTSQASRNLTLRDIGRTSLEVQQQGISNAAALTQLVEAKREFNQTYKLNVAAFMDTARRTDLTERQLEQQREMFNAEQTLAVNQLIAEMAMFGADLQFRYTATELKGDSAFAEGPMEDIAAIIADLQSLIST